MVEISSPRFAVTSCVTFSFEKECGSEKGRLLNVSGSVCSTCRQETARFPLMSVLTIYLQDALNCEGSFLPNVVTEACRIFHSADVLTT